MKRSGVIADSVVLLEPQAAKNAADARMTANKLRRASICRHGDLRKVG